MTSLKYPIGLFEKPNEIHAEILNRWINNIQELPYLLNEEVKNLNNNDLSKTYRKDSWHIRQIIHHIADSHINSYIRLKLSLTEDNPTIKPYFEDKWSNLIDANDMSVSSSLKIIEGVHERWVYLLKSLSEEDLNKTFFHPEHQKSFSIKENIGIYAWHGLHHLAHIQLAKKS